MARIILIILGLTLAVGGGIWHARVRSLAACREGAILRKAAVRSLPWFKAAAGDRFLLPLLKQGKVAEALRELRVRSAVAAGEAWSWHLSDSFKAALKSLIVNSPTDNEFYAALERFVALPVPKACPEAEDPRLLEAFAAGDEFWRSRLGEVRMAKLSFAHDEEIFCQAEALTGRLKAVLAATESRCSKSKKGCQAAATAPIQREIEDIEMQKEFNLQKLRRKWPAEILGGLKCS